VRAWDYNIKKKEKTSSLIKNMARSNYFNLQTTNWEQYILQFKNNSANVIPNIKREDINLNYAPDNGKPIFILHNVLDEQECNDFIQLSEQLGYKPMPEYDPEYRSNTRVITEQVELADEILRRIRNHVPDKLIVSKQTWNLSSLNERFRFCKYVPGQHFHPHMDARFERSKNEVSFLTFMIYLSGAFEGGETCFLRRREEGTTDNITFVHRPTVGSVLIFKHDILHEGKKLTSGTKYLMRTDLMYQRGG